MQRLLIHLPNAFALVVILIGIPNITSLHIFGLQLTSAAKMQKLTLWGLGLAASANLFGALFLAKDRKVRRLCQKWMLVHAACFVLEALLFHGYINFGWLKQSLLWLQKKSGASI